MNSETPIKTALIIGGGIAGPFAAISLAAQGITPRIFEARHSPGTLGGAINLTPNALRILSNHGLLPQILALGCPMTALEFFSAQSGALLGIIPFGDVNKYGFTSLRIARTDLQGVLLGAVEAAGLTVQYGKKLVDIREDENSVTAIFDDGTTETGDFLVGADGIYSAVRTRYLDPQTKAKYSGISSAYGFCDVDEAQKMHFREMCINTSRKGSFLMTYANPEKTRMFWAMVVAQPEKEVPVSGRSQGWKATDQDAMKREIVERYEECRFLSGPIAKLIQSTEEVYFFPVNELPLNGKWHTGRCTLVGDAAHAMPPQGQSIGLAWEDVVLMTRVLTEMPGKALQERLERWEALRRPRVNAAHAEASKTRENVSEVSPFWNWCREWMYWFFIRVFARHSNQQFVYDVSQEPL